MCCEDPRALSFETLCSDPLIRLVMESDGVTTTEMVEVLEVARAAIKQRERSALLYMATAGHA